MSSGNETNINLPNSTVTTDESHVSDFKKKLNFLQNADLFKHSPNKESPESGKVSDGLEEDVEKIRRLRQPPYQSEGEEDEEDNENNGNVGENNPTPFKDPLKKGCKKKIKEKEKKEKKKGSIRNPFKRNNTTATERPILTNTPETPESIIRNEAEKIKLIIGPVKDRPRREKLNKVNPNRIYRQHHLSGAKSNEELFKPNEAARKELAKLDHSEKPTDPNTAVPFKKPPMGGVAIFNDPTRMLTVLKTQKSKLNPIERRESMDSHETDSSNSLQITEQINDLNNNDLAKDSTSQNEIKILPNSTALKSRPKRVKCNQAVVEKKSDLVKEDLFEPPKSLNMHNETEEEINALNAVSAKVNEPKLINIRKNEDNSESKPNRVSMIPSFALRNSMMPNANFLSELKSKQTLSMYAKGKDDVIETNEEAPDDEE